MKKPSCKLFRIVDRILSGTIGPQLLFFLVLAGLIFIGLLLLSFPLGSLSFWGDHFWLVLSKYMGQGGLDDVEAVAPPFVFLSNILGKLFLSGLSIAFLVNLVKGRIDRVKNGEVYYHFKKHMIIIGFDPMVPGLIRQLIGQNNKREIVLQTAGNIPEIRRLLPLELTGKDLNQVTLVGGNRTHKEDIDKLNVHLCDMLFLMGESGEDDRDSQNIECLKIMAALLENRYNFSLRCHVLFDRQATFAAFQQQDLGEDIRKRIDFVPFNFCDLWAKKVFVDRKYNGKEIYVPLDRKDGIGIDSDKHVHLVILGMSNMGIALGIQAAHICHFPNFVSKKIKTKITFIDENAEREMERLKGHYRHLFEETSWSYKGADLETRINNPNQKEKFTDIEFEFIQAGFEQELIQKHLIELSVQENTLLTIAVALQQNPAASLAVALYMPPAVYESKTQILVWQDRSYATVSMLSEELKNVEYRKYRNLRPFGMLANAFDLDSAEDILPMKIKYIYGMADKITKVTRAYNKLKQKDREPANEDIAEEIRKNIHDAAEAKRKNIQEPDKMKENEEQEAREKDEWTGQMVETVKNAARKPGSTEFPVTGSVTDGIVRTYNKSEIEKNWNTNWKPKDNVSALKASNRYCADFTKVQKRSFAIEPGKDLKDIKTDTSTGKGTIYYAARVEHNRWVAEKLILGFRAPTSEDAKKISSEKRKDVYKERLIHNDIRDYEDLVKDDKGVDVREYDRNIVCALPFMLEEYEKTNGIK
ncbi:MAG: hypothetical protein LBE14_07865 [Treponema sp.]|jgi:hypothetical protein|nr:hypothetical protein [Treponema sp.]